MRPLAVTLLVGLVAMTSCSKKSDEAGSGGAAALPTPMEPPPSTPMEACTRYHREMLYACTTEAAGKAPSEAEARAAAARGASEICAVLKIQEVRQPATAVLDALRACDSVPCGGRSECVALAVQGLPTGGYFCERGLLGATEGTPFKCPGDPRCTIQKATPCPAPGSATEVGPAEPGPAEPGPEEVGPAEPTPSAPAEPVGPAEPTNVVQPEADATPVAEVPQPEPPVGIGRVSVEVVRVPGGADRGKKYIRVQYMATVREALTSRDVVEARAACAVGGDVFVDDAKAFGESLDELDPGQSKRIETPLFVRQAFDDTPTRCDLTFSLVQPDRRAGTPLGQFCWTGRSVEEGPCPTE